MSCHPALLLLAGDPAPVPRIARRNDTDAPGTVRPGLPAMVSGGAERRRALPRIAEHVANRVLTQSPSRRILTWRSYPLNHHPGLKQDGVFGVKS